VRTGAAERLNGPKAVAATWSEEEAIVEHGGGIPHAWAEGYARLHPDRPPDDVPPKAVAAVRR
jgi:hypothetical protein